ncbi:hypothetical protein KJ853_00200, partial [Patescibacteria group bacterium]|nr:hypothetical protein [Patescibacteria group bacterium]
GGAFLVAAGIIKMPFDKFMLSNLLATLVKSMILLLVGFYFGQAYVTIGSYLEKLTVIVAATAVILLLIYIFYFRKKTDNNSQT